MPVSYKTPGVYVEEISSGSRPITAVGTSTAGFLGVAPKDDANLNKVVRINNWQHFVKEFTGDEKSITGTNLALGVYGFFQNGGSTCYVLNLGKEGSIAGEGNGRSGIDLFKTIDEIAIIAAPGYTGVEDYEVILSHCEKAGDRFAILDAPSGVCDVDKLTKTASLTNKKGGFRARESVDGYGAYYFPWIYSQNVFNPKENLLIPPSGHLAGVYARVDNARGVHKAPANESIRGALDLEFKITKEENGDLNVNSVNCLRFFPDSGIKIWGARTLASADSPWRYISVRRLFNMIEESIEESTRWVVFEPNDRTLWNSIKRDVGAFLKMLWRSGALMGATPEEAFYVKCDEETNPQEVIDQGQVITEIGIAPVKPAEFVVFRIGQSQSES